MQPPFRGQKQNQVLRAWILYLMIRKAPRYMIILTVLLRVIYANLRSEVQNCPSDIPHFGVGACFRDNDKKVVSKLVWLNESSQ